MAALSQAVILLAGDCSFSYCTWLEGEQQGGAAIAAVRVKDEPLD
jgi:hypothetical protein